MTKADSFGKRCEELIPEYGQIAERVRLGRISLHEAQALRKPLNDRLRALQAELRLQGNRLKLYA